MKKLTVLLTVTAFALVLFASSAFATTFATQSKMQHSFRNQATAGLFDDPADDITDGTDVIRYYPKWVLLTRFSNILAPVAGGGAGPEDQLFNYGAGSNSPNTFYGLMGSSEWFETNLGMPINFAVSYSRDGNRVALLDHDMDGATANVSSATGNVTSTREYTDRENYTEMSDTRWNFTAGYSVNQDLTAGVTYGHTNYKVKLVDTGDVSTDDINTPADDGSTTTYENGLSGDTLNQTAEDKFKFIGRQVINPDVIVKGYLTLGYYRGQNNQAERIADADYNSVFTTNTVATGDNPQTAEVEANLTGTTTSVTDLEIDSKNSGLIFGLKGKVYYKPLYKGEIESELGYEYRGGTVTKNETFTTGVDAAEIEETAEYSGRHTEHTLSWETERTIEVDKIEAVLGLYWERNSETDTGTVTIEHNETGVTDQDAESTLTDKTVTHTWSFPIGAELEVKEKWTVRVGAEHSVELSTQTVTNDLTFGPSTMDDLESTTVTKTDTRETSYKYGVGYAWSENLQIDINGFLQETPDAGDGERADIWDLSTYRNIALSAALIF